MNILQVLKQLRDDLKTWATNNFNALNAKIEEKTIPIDSELDSNSTNPVQNKAITTEIADINERVGNTSVKTQISNAVNSIPKFSGDYNDLDNAPNIAEDDSGNMVIADEAGNVIFKVDADGVHTTDIEAKNIVTEDDDFVLTDENGNIIFKVDAEGIHSTDLTLNGKSAATEEYVDNAIANIDIPDVDFTGYATESYVDSVKAELSESITSEDDDWSVVDAEGNIIMRVDANGFETTQVVAKSAIINGVDITSFTPMTDDEINAIVDSVFGEGGN